MKKFIAMLALVAVVAGVMAIVGGGQAFAAVLGSNQEELRAATVKAADLHLSRQDTYSGIDNTWEWVIGTGGGYWNVVGISATGLLAAYERTGDTDYLNGAVATGSTLVTHYDALSNDFAGRPYSQDVEFLVRLAVDSVDSSYATKAATYYARITANKTAVQTADRYIADRSSLAGWDLASQIRAAVAVGNSAYASGMAARLIERRTVWEGDTAWGIDLTTLSHASLLWAFRALGDKSFNGYVGEIRDSLLAAQGGNGSWYGGDYQATAYAILGLSANGSAKGAQARAWAFLRDTQNTLGGWDYSGVEYGEETSEVLMALGALNLTGQQIGHTDPQPDRGGDTGKHPRDPAP